MKKRFFNALILGAVLLSTGAVTSCKDYDDDINNLQNQIDELATADQLKTAVDQLNTAVGAATADADAAMKAAQAAQSTADKKADAATVTALENAVKDAKAAADKANADLATAKTELQTLIDSKASAEDLKKANDKIADAEKAIEAAKKAATDADAALKKEMTQAVADATKDLVTKAALDAEVKALDGKINSLVGDKVAEQMKALQKQLEELQGIADKLKIAYSSMITDIQLFSSGTNSNIGDGMNGSATENFDATLNFIQATEVDSKWRVYGSDTEGWDFVKGNYYLGMDSVLVRVSPANAVLNKEAISLLNSQGKNANDVVEVESVYKYDRLMTKTRANASETGLWVVKFRAKNVEDAFAAAAIDKSMGYERSIVYAVAVDNDVKNVSDTRRVTSEYALDLKTTVAAHGYDFMVSTSETNRCIQEIHNRYERCDDGTSTIKVPELVWMDQHKPYALENVKTDGADRNALNRSGDNRQDKYILSVEKGKVINIDFNCYWHTQSSADIKGFYVTLDEAFAIESTPSEINAWKSYEYVGVGYTKTDGTVVPATLFEGNKGTIVIKDMNNVVGDVIGFRVHAVNYDGTVTDPDGRAFYVAVGDVKTDVAINEGKAVEVKYTDFNGELKFVSDFIATDVFDVDFNSYINWENNTKDLSGIAPTFTVKYYDENKVETTIWNKNVKFVRFVLDNPAKFIDGGTYTQQLTLSNKAASGASSTPIRTITATITKVMPTGPEFGYLVNMDKNQWPIPANGDYVIGSQPKGAHIDLNNFLISMNNKYTAGQQSLKTENGNYQFNIANGTYLWDIATSKYYNGDAFVEANGVFGNQIYTLDIVNHPSMDVDKKNLIDNTTSHAITAEYNFAGISKRPKNSDDVQGITDNDVWNNNYVEGVDYVAAVASTAEIVYHTWLDNGTLKGGNTWTGAYNNSDKTKYYVEWNSNPAGDNWQFDLSKAEVKVNGRVVPAYAPKDASGVIKNLAAAIKGGFLEVLASDIPNMPFKAYTKNGSQINPYYEVTAFDETTCMITIQQNNQVTQVPSLPIDGTVIVFKVKDCFGNIFDVELPFGIKRGIH